MHEFHLEVKCPDVTEMSHTLTRKGEKGSACLFLQYASKSISESPTHESVKNVRDSFFLPSKGISIASFFSCDI